MRQILIHHVVTKKIEGNKPTKNDGKHNHQDRHATWLEFFQSADYSSYDFHNIDKLDCRYVLLLKETV